MPKLFKFLAVLLALPLVLTGCKIKSINYFPPTPAHIRVVNVLATTSPIDVAANGVVAWSGLTFEAMTGYQEFTNNSTTITVSLTGSSTPFLSQTYLPAGNENYTLVIYGTVNAPLIAVIADQTQPPPSGKSTLNFFDAAPLGHGVSVGNYALDVYVTPPGQVLDNISPTFTAVQYGNSNLFAQYSAGQYQLRLTITATKTVVYDSGVLNFQEQTATDVIIYSRGSQVLANVLLDDVDGAGQQVVANNLLARIKAVNAAFQTGPVNQLLNGVPQVNNLPYPAASAYLIVPSGTGTVSFEASAAPGATIASVTGTFVPATDNSVFVSGFAGATSAVPLTDSNLPPASNFAAVRFINASPNSAPFDVFAGQAQLASAVGAYTASSYVQLLSAVYELTFKDSATGATILTLSDNALAAQQTFSVYVVGPPGAVAGLVTADTP
jgi:hypothetical protein